jgi:hypothetical protein
VQRARTDSNPRLFASSLYLPVKVASRGQRQRAASVRARTKAEVAGGVRRLSERRHVHPPAKVAELGALDTRHPIDLERQTRKSRHPEAGRTKGLLNEWIVAGVHDVWAEPNGLTRLHELAPASFTSGDAG